MPRQLVKDLAAEADLIGVWLYSNQHWGERQADRYLDAIESALRRTLVDPESGNSRMQRREGYWSLRAQHHVLFYTFTRREVRLRRVLHEAMDPDINM